MWIFHIPGQYPNHRIYTYYISQLRTALRIQSSNRHCDTVSFCVIAGKQKKDTFQKMLLLFQSTAQTHLKPGLLLQNRTVNLSSALLRTQIYNVIDSTLSHCTSLPFRLIKHVSKYHNVFLSEPQMETRISSHK